MNYRQNTLKYKLYYYLKADGDWVSSMKLEELYPDRKGSTISRRLREMRLDKVIERKLNGVVYYRFIS